jgi:spore coat protein H
MKKLCWLFVLFFLLSIDIPAQIPQYGVTMSPADYDSLYARDIWSDVYLNSPFTSYDTLWAGAKIKFKGHSTRYFPKKPYRVRFTTSNLFYNYRDVNFNPMYTDKSCMREKLAWDLFADMGATTPFCYHADFSINGESKGLFSFINKVDKYFLTNKGFTLGSLYEANDTYTMADLTVQPDSLLALYYDINNGPNRDDLKSLIQALNDTPDSNFYQVVTRLIDTNSVLNWFCGNTLTMMGDSYNKNYNLFHDTTKPTQQWMIIPWDYDLSWGRSGDLTKPYPSSLLNDGFAYTYPPLAGPSNVLKDRWVATPELMELFRLRLKNILDSIFTEERFCPRIDSLAKLIENNVLRDPYKWGTIQDFYEHVEALKYFVTVRRNYLYKTFINPPFGEYNVSTLPVSHTNIPYHFVTYDGRTIATLWFTSIDGLDSVTVYAYPDSTPPLINDPATERYIKRWIRIIPYPGTAKFNAKLQFMYQDIQADYTEVGAGVQDERLLRAGYYDGTHYESLSTKINSFANTATIDSITENQVGYNKYIAAMVSDTYTQKWFRQKNYFWQRLFDVKFMNLDTGYAVGDHGTFFKTNDGGATWTDKPIGINLPFFKMSMSSQFNIFVVGEFGSIYKSVDEGETWTRLLISTNNNIRNINMSSAQTVVVVGDKGLAAFSSDSGKSWNVNVLDSTKNFFGAGIFSDQSSVIAGEKGIVYFADDSLKSWQIKNPAVTTDLFAVKIYMDSQVFIAGDSGTVIVTTDRGDTWENIGIPVPVKLYDIAVQSDNSIYVVGKNGKIFYTDNRGVNWYSQYSADSHDLYAVTLVSTDYGVAVGNQATVLKTSESGTTTGIIGPLASMPADFKLFQNYPNPFNPVTIINYQLPNDNFVTLRVYDILGREVKTLVNEFKKAGNHLNEFEGSNLSSGVYFYKLQIGNQFAQTKKLILLR